MKWNDESLSKHTEKNSPMSLSKNTFFGRPDNISLASNFLFSFVFVWKFLSPEIDGSGAK
jgi:hypothetical protein